MPRFCVTHHACECYMRDRQGLCRILTAAGCKTVDEVVGVIERLCAVEHAARAVSAEFDQTDCQCQGEGDCIFCELRRSLSAARAARAANGGG